MEKINCFPLSPSWFDLHFFLDKKGWPVSIKTEILQSFPPQHTFQVSPQKHSISLYSQKRNSFQPFKERASMHFFFINREGIKYYLRFKE
jgi:hypothetical protein